MNTCGEYLVLVDGPNCRREVAGAERLGRRYLIVCAAFWTLDLAPWVGLDVKQVELLRDT